jgi:signal transduction histidine kinase
VIDADLELALAAGGMGSWEWDSLTNRVSWSPQLEAIHGLAPGTFGGTFEDYLSDVYPDDLPYVRRWISESLERGEHHVEYRIVWPDYSVHWVEAHGRVVRDAAGQPIGLRGVCLESSRVRVFRALHELAVALAGVLEPVELARVVARRARELLGVGGVGMYVLEDSGTLLVPLHSSDDDERSPEPPLKPGEGAAGQAFTRGEPVAVPDYMSWQEGGAWARAQLVAAALAVPLRVADRTIGALSVRSYIRRTWTDDDVRTLGLLAAQVAPRLEAARLHKRTRDEARERGILLAREQLSRERLEVALEAGHMGAWDFDAHSQSVTFSPQLELIHGFESGTFGGTLDAYFAHIYDGDVPGVRTALADALVNGTLNVEYRTVTAEGEVHWFEARGRIVRDEQEQVQGLRGVCLDVTARKLADAERIRLVDRERVALEAKAALEERQRLARDLHDSVSQALYGITLGAQVALDALQHDENPAAAVDATRYVLGLADAGMAELRALILELRPESLEQEGLVAAIDRHASALRTAHALQVVTRLGFEPDLPLVAKEAVYRIVQEALHNTVRHARAHTVQLTLDRSEGGVCVRISDDGVGFDPELLYPGHLGLTSMRERARGVGGDLSIASIPGHGTQIDLRVPISA